MERWKLEDAKARMSELVRRAGTAGPQLVTVRGKEAAVVIAPEDYERLLPKKKREKPLVDFLQGLALGELKLERARESVRDPDL